MFAGSLKLDTTSDAPAQTGGNKIRAEVL